MALLLTAVVGQETAAETRQHDIAPERLDTLAGQLVEMTADKGVSSACRLHLMEIENFTGPLLTHETRSALEASVGGALLERYPEADCEAGFREGFEGVEEAEIARGLAEEGRPGFLYTLSFFPHGDGLLLLATAYRPDGSFAAFSNRTEIDTVIAEAQQTPTAKEPPVPAVKPAVPADTDTAVAENPSPPMAGERDGGLAAIGTPAEIAAIKARKFAAMPADPEPAPPPEIGLRINIGGAVEPAVIKDLARAFLAAQPDGSPAQTVIEDQDRLRLADGGAALRGIEILDSDREVAFDQLFRGDVDLVVSTDPIAQADYDRFAQAFGVDMRSGAGETVIGIDATGLIVHTSNNLASVTTEVAAKIFSGDVTAWEQDDVAMSGLAGPIQALAPSYQVGLHDGYAVRPDLILKANAEVAGLVEINPLSIGIGNAVMVAEDGHRTLAIEECGITYTPDEFFLRTEDHPLARRLFLYSNPAEGNRFRNAFLFFATSDAGQDLIGRHAVDLDVTFGGPEKTRDRVAVIETQPSAAPDLRAELIDTIAGARRLSTTFRFRFDSPELRLDQHAARDLANLIRLSRSENIDPRRLMLLGFADADGPSGYNEILSLERAQAIAKRLRTYGLPIPAANVRGFGEEAPVACNVRPDGTQDDVGKERNRRVEIWLRDEIL